MRGVTSWRTNHDLSTLRLVRAVGRPFCLNCGTALNPAGPTRHLGNAVDAPYDAALAVEEASYPSAAAGYGTPAQAGYGVPDGDPYQSPRRLSYGGPRPVDTSQDRQWATGSSFPAPNPYSGTPNTVSPGTIVNGRPVGSGSGGGLFKGVGAGIAALFVILAKAGGALAGLGFVFAKFWIWIWAFNLLFHGGLVALVVLLLVLLVLGAIRQSRTGTV